jgi:hypothetical protein
LFLNIHTMKIALIVIVAVTAKPYAADRLCDDLKINIIAKTAINKIQLTDPIYICDLNFVEVYLIFIKGKILRFIPWKTIAITALIIA